MPVLHRDFETRSTLALKNVGAWRYAGDPTTEVLCVAFAVDDGAVQIWLPGQPIPEVFHIAARDPDWLVAAHNDFFESSIEARILGPHFGWPLVPIERHRCTMAAALASALPGSLDGAAAALGLDLRKDVDGEQLMKKMCKPLKPRKGEDRNIVRWLEGPEQLEQLCAYCKRDVEVERELYGRLPPLSESEQATWVIDQIINRRGFAVDTALAGAGRGIAGETSVEINAEIAERTGGRITSAGQVARFKTLLEERGHKAQSLGKRAVAALLANKPDPDIARLLQLRQQGGKASASKLETLLASADAGRLHGTMQFHGSSTGRWAGRGFQPHNLPRAQPADPEAAIAAVLAGDIERVRAIGPPLDVVGSLSRAMIRVAPGRELIGADYSSIEVRVIAWLAGETWLLDLFRRYDATGDPALDPYCVTASKILGRPVTPEDDAGRQIGKMCMLAFCFGGGLGAFKKIAPDADFTDAQIETFKTQWRRAHPKICAFWRGLFSMLLRAMRTGKPETFKNLGAELRSGNLYLCLPGDRELVYPEACVEPGERGDPVIWFMDNAKGLWQRPPRSWFGLFVENTVQAIARDLLVAAMPQLEAAGYPIVLHVHDDIVAEVSAGFGSPEEFAAIMTALPAWAGGLPLAAKPRRSRRYAKEGGDASTESIEETRPLESAQHAAPIECSAERAPEVAAMLQFNVVRTTAPIVTVCAPPLAAWTPDPDDEAVECAESPAAPLFDPGAIPEVTAAPPALAAAIADMANRIAAEPSPGEHCEQQSNDQPRGSRGNYNYSEKQAGKPYSDAHLLAQGYLLARVFPYQLPDGTQLYEECRYELRAGIAPTKQRPHKTSRFRHVADGVTRFDTGPRRIIYNWPAIVLAGPGGTVHITEGANKSAPLIAAGLLATAAAYHKWTPECVEALAGRHLIYHEDFDLDDDKGRNKGRELSADARQKLAPGAGSFRIVPVAHLFKQLGREPWATADVKDWLEAGGDATKLEEICREIPTENDDPHFWHGEPDPRERKKWRIKHLMPEVGAGLLPGQWGTFKSFMAIELATTVIAAGGEFCGRQLVTPCGVLILATEGTFELRDRIDAAVQEKYPEMTNAPITWRESCPTLLADNAFTELTKVIEKAAEECKARFQMPLGLVIIDVLADAAGYAKSGDENDPAVGAKLMGVLHRAAEICDCFVLAVDHFGKSIEAGTRGTSAKEGSADIILACLGEREVSGTITNSRLALRKVRGGPQGQEFPFKARVVPVPRPSDDGIETTCVIDWEAGAQRLEDDPWEKGARQLDAKLGLKALRRAIMKLSAEHGKGMVPEPGADAVRMIEQELVREEFFANTAADGDARQKQKTKQQRFRRALDRAENQNLIGRRDIEGRTYLWLVEP